MPRSKHYPIELVNDTDEIAGGVQSVQLWVPRGWTVDEARALLAAYV